MKSKKAKHGHPVKLKSCDFYFNEIEGLRASRHSPSGSVDEENRYLDESPEIKAFQILIFPKNFP